MPELPEVETTRRGLLPYLQDSCITNVTVHQSQLRFAIHPQLPSILKGQHVSQISRRGKYLLFAINQGHLLIHLGMSGSLRLVTDKQIRKHDHVVFEINHDYCLHYHDPRRFGAILWTTKPLAQHKLLQHLGVEPLSDTFSVDYLYPLAQKRHIPIKQFIMDHHVVVGVGNIYAQEALFTVKINPLTPVSQLSKAKLAKLVAAIREILQTAINAGGTTLRDFVNSQGNPGYFSQSLQVYGKASQACPRCKSTLVSQIIAQRNTVFCERCQK